MSYVGKILVAVQFVLAIIFMVFAGVVYSTHMNWRADSEAKKKQISELNGKLQNKEAELTAKTTELTAKATEAVQKQGIAEAANTILEQEKAALVKQNADLQVARRSATEQALIAGEEAKSRTSEADNLRTLNHELTVKRDQEYALRTKLEDEKRSLEIVNAQAALKNKQLITEKGVLQQALEANGINANVAQLQNKNAPPPRVEGQVMDVKKASRQGTSELIEISLGSDDGLKQGHEMTVYRTGLDKGAKAKYLARISIVRVDPDRAVGQVIESSRNGVIQKGDNVSTKL